MENKRQFKRVDMKTEIRILSNNDLFFGSSMNISACGLLLKSDIPLEIGSLINVKVMDPKSFSFHEMDAEVVRVESESESSCYHIGIKFVDFDKKKQEDLDMSLSS